MILHSLSEWNMLRVVCVLLWLRSNLDPENVRFIGGTVFRGDT